LLLVDNIKLAGNHIRRALNAFRLQKFLEAENSATALTILKENTSYLMITN
jgi:PleD family two-component response regulator